MDNRIVTITPFIPKGYNGNKPYTSVSMMLIDDATLNQATGGGWQIVDRPKMMAATQWSDTAPWQLSFKVYLDSRLTKNVTNTTRTFTPNVKISPSLLNALSGGTTQSTKVISIIDSVEGDCAEIMSWVEFVPGTLLPPLLKIQGAPLPLQQGSTESIQYWVLNSVQFNAAIRDSSGHRIQQDIDLVFYQYVPPLNDPNFVPALGPARKVKTAANTSSSSSNKTVQKTHRRNVPTGDYKTMTAFTQRYNVKADQVTTTDGKQIPINDYKNFNKRYKFVQIP
jgi:hypothetical protein